ncbi:UNVERIFIED_CONTAM: hypothetical protein NCL1_41095 [Trichonephila clavipes]
MHRRFNVELSFISILATDVQVCSPEWKYFDLQTSPTVTVIKEKNVLLTK